MYVERFLTLVYTGDVRHDPGWRRGMNGGKPLREHVGCEWETHTRQADNRLARSFCWIRFTYVLCSSAAGDIYLAADAQQPALKAFSWSVEMVWRRFGILTSSGTIAFTARTALLFSALLCLSRLVNIDVLQYRLTFAGRARTC